MRARRPLRRRLATIARPARVRIRNRKPCTRARRRLFGWKVRLPFATTLSSSRLRPHSDRTIRVGHAHPHEALGRPSVSLYRRGPRVPRIAAVSPTFGRLFEGTDRPPRGQTSPAHTRRTSLLSHLSRHRPAIWFRPGAILQKRLAPAPKTVSFGQCRFRPERRPTMKRGRRTGSSPKQSVLGTVSLGHARSRPR